MDFASTTFRNEARQQMSDDRTHSPVSYTYGALNVLFSLLYGWLFFWLVPSRSALWDVAAALICAVCLSSAVGMLVPRVWGRRLAVVAALALIGVCATLIVLLVASAAYLHGIYNGVGQAGTIIALVVAALAIELVGLVPALQLAHIARATRRAG